MDECPRCQGSLEELSLGDVSTVTCPHCEYADIPVEHERVPETPESWRDALNRFYEETVPKVESGAEVEVASAPTPMPIPESRSDAESESAAESASELESEPGPEPKPEPEPESVPRED